MKVKDFEEFLGTLNNENNNDEQVDESRINRSKYTKIGASVAKNYADELDDLMTTVPEAIMDQLDDGVAPGDEEFEVAILSFNKEFKKRANKII